MFTGLIQAQARVRALERGRKGARLVLDVPPAWSRIKIGASVAVDGACLTVSSRAGRRLSFDLLNETLKSTHFSSLKPGDTLNLERPLSSGQKIEGHFVQGHVDVAGQLRRVLSGKKQKSLQISFPRRLSPFFIPKASVAVNGVSLTLGKTGRGSFWVHLIPQTLKKTNLDRLKAGDRVNLEADVLLKFLHRLTRPQANYKLGR